MGSSFGAGWGTEVLVCGASMDVALFFFSFELRCCYLGILGLFGAELAVGKIQVFPFAFYVKPDLNMSHVASFQWNGAGRFCLSV